MKTTISEKGQITIPKPCRERLGLRPGMVLDVETDHGKLVVRKKHVEDMFEKWAGKGRLPGGMSVDEYLNRARG